MPRSLVLATVLATLCAPQGAAQERYRIPPEPVRTILDAPSLPSLFPSPDGSMVVLAERPQLATIRELSQPMLRLAGLRINPTTSDRFATRLYRALTVQDARGGARAVIALPDDPRVSDVAWSPTGSWVAFVQAESDGLALWVVNSRTGESKALTEPVLNGVMGSACRWMPGGDRLLCHLVPEGRGAEPAPPAVPVGPIVRRNDGPPAPVRTYQDLLTSPSDGELFAHYASSQLALVDVESGAVQPVGTPGIFLEADPSPGGTLILVERVVRPFAYVVPVWRFAHEIEVWNLEGERVFTLASVPVADNVPISGVRTGPRSVSWRPDHAATLVYVEALDGGDTYAPAEERDKVMLLAAPFTSPVELARLALRYAGTSWGRGGVVLVSESERRTRKLRTWKVNADDPAAGWRIIVDRSTEDRYNDPGTPLMTRNDAGRLVLQQDDDGEYIYLVGPGASPEGDRPFLDRMDLEDRETRRLWQAGDGVYEQVVEMLDDRGRELVIRRESDKSPPNYFYTHVRNRTEVALTDIPNPAPELATVRRELLHYERADGVELSGTLFYPTTYEEGQRVPVIFWIYPREFVSAAAASQVRGSPHRFVLPRGASQLFLLTQGYAVLDNPTLPVVGGDSANNTYQEQTVAGARAAVEYLTARGIADGNFGVGGHSYGAFATANLLAHSDLFRAGVARSGAYNRTLTPFGFQNERRTFWEAPELYLYMMPFSHVPKINEPILLIHGMNDNNSGTFPVQSERMYHALKGHGATVEYVQLPFESHGYVARESVMDAVARMIEWYDRYVKGGGETASDASSP